MNEEDKKEVTPEDLEEFKGKIAPELLEKIRKFAKAKSFEPIQPELPDFDKMTLEDLKQWDKVGYINVAEDIVRQIERYSPSLIYGVYGKWGSGKTTMMQMMKKIIDENRKYATVWFNPWVYENSERDLLFIGLLRKIQKEVRRRYGKCLSFIITIGSWIGKILLFLVIGIFAILWMAAEALLSRINFSTDKIERYYRKLYKGLRKDQLKKMDSVEERTRKLEKAIKKALKRVDAEKLILFIDDLDRCLPDRAILLLDQLKNFLEVPNVVTVLGVDDNALKEALNKRYKREKSEADFGKEYLEKIVRDHYQLSIYVLHHLLSKYEPLAELMEDPWVAGQINRALGSAGDLSLRQLGRALLKYDYLYHHLFSRKVAEMISGTYSIDQPNWQGYINQRYMAIDMGKAASKGSDHYEGKPTMQAAMASEEWAQANFEAVLIALWYVVLLVNKYKFPLEATKIETEDNPIPLVILNATYNFFRPWL